MATFSDNTTIKIDTAVAAAASIPAFGTTVNIYTCPANCYAILQASVLLNSAFGDTLALFVGGIAVRTFKSNSGNREFPFSDDIGNEDTSPIQIYVGPGQTVRIDGGGGSVGRVSGIQFKNSPV